MRRNLHLYGRPVLFIVILTIVTISVWYLAFQKVTHPVPKICFASSCFEVEVVDTDQTRQYGLMNRTHLDRDKWMLFVFEQEKIYPFWMKNTLIPLDMIWLDKDWKIIDIQTAQPCKEDPCPNYTPVGSGLYVLEINAGRAQSLWLHIWTMSKFNKK